MVEIVMKTDGNILRIQLKGKLQKQDYDHFSGEVEALLKQHDKVRILLELIDFRGWSAGALWEDLKFDFRHFNDIERLAIVGSKAWEKGMAVFCKPFTRAKIRYFDTTEYPKAEKWIHAED